MRSRHYAVRIFELDASLISQNRLNMKLENKLFSIDDRSQTDRVAIIACMMTYTGSM